MEEIDKRKEIRKANRKEIKREIGGAGKNE
jgi:hypothetical protein